MDKDFYADGKTKAHLYHARVLEKFRSKGIGSYLVKIAEDEARKQGFREMTLGVEETNTDAIKLYEKLDYQEYIREKGNEGETIVGMKKNL